jgi:hypothetical protein
MNIARIIIVLTFLCSFSFAQNNIVKSTNKYVDLIDKHVKENLLTKKQADKMSIFGGSVTSYYLNKKLVLITTKYGGEFGYIAHSYYIENDTLVFASEKKIILKEPETEKEYSAYEKYLIFNTDKNGNTDLTKWPLTVNISNDYYFNKKQLIKYQLKSFDKPEKVSEGQIEETARELMQRYATHLEELK